MSKHTPTPWILVPKEKAQSRWIVGDQEGGSIADFEPPGPWMTGQEADANAQLSLRAVNNFAPLVEALKDARAELDISTLETDEGSTQRVALLEAIAKIDSALAQAGAE